MGKGNPGCALDMSWLKKVHVNEDDVLRKTAELKDYPEFEKDILVGWQLLALRCIDLTSLSGDETASNIEQLCAKAITPLSSEVLLGLGLDKPDIGGIKDVGDVGNKGVDTADVKDDKDVKEETVDIDIGDKDVEGPKFVQDIDVGEPNFVQDIDVRDAKDVGYIKVEEVRDYKRITTAAVCVYPSHVATAANYIQRAGLKDKVSVASVAAGFPSGQFPLETRLQEIRWAVESGATEIDIVIDRGLVLCHNWEKLYTEIKLMKEACGPAHMKTILSAGELDNSENIYKASLVAMMAGSDFIKTSTGKEAINATLPIALVMCRAIAEYHRATGIMVGFKPAGGIRTSKDAIGYMIVVRETLGSDWLNPEMFRIGASGLLGDLQQELYRHVKGDRDHPNRLTMA